MTLHESAQRYFVDKFLNWSCVERRLKKFQAIRRAFPMETLKKGVSSSPYCCHYMAWRLGTSKEDCLLQRFEDLLIIAQKLPNWKKEHSLLTSPDFSVFWSLVWQLQVAEYLSEIGSDVSWSESGSGPDLSAVVGGERWYVECYTYQKSFVQFLFLQEVLSLISEDVSIDYNRCLPFQLPQNQDRMEFLDRVLSEFRSEDFLNTAQVLARKECPVDLFPNDSGPLKIVVEGNDSYKPQHNAAGDPERYSCLAINETLNAKKNSNKLVDHHPNIVAVNYLLSQDFQSALHSLRTRRYRRYQPKDFRRDSAIDVLVYSAVGIDERLTHNHLRTITVNRSARLNRSSLDRIAGRSDC